MTSDSPANHPAPLPRTVLPNARVTPRFAGLATFCRFPRLADVAPAQQPVDWIVYGAPYDGGVTYRPGARFAPRAVRDASQYLKPYHLEHAVNLCEHLSLADGGDAPVAPYDPEDNARTVASWATALPPAGAKLLAVGGDHSVAYANIRATWERAGKPKGGLALVHFDAHLDTVDQVWGERWGHASVFRRAIEDGLIDPRAMLSLGVRGPLNTGADLDFARTHGVRIVTAAQARQDGSRTLRDFVGQLAGRPAYLTFDIDVVDPAFAPGTGTPCCGGLSSAEGLGLLRDLRGVRLAGADVVEVLPDRDVSDITALLASHVIIEVLALDAIRAAAQAAPDDA